MLQKVGAYLFVFLYVVAMLKPIAPYIEYAINYDYISKVLCINKDKEALKCNGKCQLMQKLKQQQNNDYKSLTINLKDYPIGFINLLQFYKKIDSKSSKSKTFTYCVIYKYKFNSTIFHPPIS